MIILDIDPIDIHLLVTTKILLVAGLDCLAAANPLLSVNHNKPLPIDNCM